MNMFVNYNKVIFPSILGRNFLFYFPQYSILGRTWMLDLEVNYPCIIGRIQDVFSSVYSWEELGCSFPQYIREELGCFYPKILRRNLVIFPCILGRNFEVIFPGILGRKLEVIYVGIVWREFEVIFPSIHNKENLR